MQVTHVEDHVTHAVIGGKQAVSFGITDDANFFNILSDTLYSDKILAVVRETLCNAWDAHVQSSRTHLPVTVTLTKSKLTIRDYGTGIKKTLMHSVYCIYGASTKKHDGQQNGGFGLGCKSPFAYTDHFEVTNFNGGQKTLYKISKSSGEVGGKPGLQEIASVPSDEHGLQVSIDLRPSDYVKFSKKIEQIVNVGDMNVKLNDVQLSTIPFNTAKQGFLITNDILSMDSDRQIFVRYGNVAYPVDLHDDYRKLYQEALNLLEWLNGRHYRSNYKLVLLAQPHTISVTPSRESLSMTDFTIATLHGLLENFHKLRLEQMENQCLRIAQEGINRCLTTMNPSLLFGTWGLLPGLGDCEVERNPHLIDFEQISQAYVFREYPRFAEFRNRDIAMRIHTLEDTGYGGPTNRGRLQSFLSAYQRADTTWFHRRLVGPLVTKLKAHPLLSETRLMVYGKNASRKKDGRISYSDPEFTEATQFSKNDMEYYLPFLRNFVILTHNRADVQERVHGFPGVDRWIGNPRNALVYCVQRSSPKIEASRAFFESQGFYVLDLTRRHQWEPEPVKVIKTRDYKSRKKGIPILSSILTDDGKKIAISRDKKEDVGLIEAPEFLVKIAEKNNSNCFAGLNPRVSRDVVKLFGSKGGIVVSATQVEKYEKLGAKDMSGWITPKIMEEIRNNTRLHRYLSVDPVNYGFSSPSSQLNWNRVPFLVTVTKDRFLRAHFDISHDATPDDLRYLRIWRSLWEDMYIRNIPEEVKAFRAYLKTFKPDQKLLDLVGAIHNSTLMDMVNHTAIERVLTTTNKTNDDFRHQQAKIRDLLIWAIKG